MSHKNFDKLKKVYVLVLNKQNEKSIFHIKPNISNDQNVDSSLESADKSRHILVRNNAENSIHVVTNAPQDVSKNTEDNLITSNVKPFETLNPNIKYVAKNVNIKKTYQCIECGKCYLQNRNLKNHMKNIHPFLKIQPKKKFCEKCKTEFQFHSRLKRHKCEPDKPVNKPKRICPLCNAHLICNASRANYFSHFESEHNIPIEKEMFELTNYESFKKWKTNVEETTFSKFVMIRGIKKYKDYCAMRYYSCHRSGFHIPSGRGLRRMKLKGSNKINAHCPAEIKLMIAEDGRCEVKFIKTHIGHEKDLNHLVLSHRERLILAAKIAKKQSFNEILDDIHSKSISNPKFQRLKLVTRKDLHNIKSTLEATLRNSSTDLETAKIDLEEGYSDTEETNAEINESNDIEADINDPDNFMSFHDRKERLKNDINNIIDNVTLFEHLEIIEHYANFIKSELSNKK